MKKKWKDCFPCRGKYVKIFRIMKLCTCLLFCSMMTLSAGVRGQHIKMSLDMKGVTLEEVIWTLEKKSDITFFYNVSDVSKVTNVSAVFKDASLEAILDMLLKGTNLYYEIQNRVVVIKSGQPMSVQDSLKGVTVKGVVKDSRGGMLPGVTVVLKGTTTGVATGISGDFVITIPKRDSVTLLFSFVGMKTKEVKWRGQTELTVVLEEDMNEMEEVVITGYQVIDRRKSTSAVSSVKMEDIMIPGVSTLDKMLEGQIPDLMVMTNSGESGVAPKIRIRGTSTLIGNREPLWVIDGVIVQDPVQISPDELNDPDYINRIGNAISGINPQDIERIDVLKDASATALYGTKAANGVIVITTKRGHVGEPQISYRGTATLKLRPRYSDRNIDLMNAKERLNVSRELAEAGYQYATSVTWVGYEKLLRELYNRTISYEEFEKQVAYLGKENTDWFKLLTRDAFSSSHTVSVTGGTEKVRYYSSVGVNIEEDVVKPNLDRRYTGTLNLDMNFTPWLAASFNVNANTSKRKYYQEEIAPINYAYNTSRAIPAYTEEGKYSFYLIPSGFSYYDYNILNELENSSKRQEGSSVTFRANLDVKPWEWLKISTILSYSVANTDIEGYWGTKTYHAALIRRSADEAGADKTSGMPRGGELTVDKSRNKSYMFRLQADLNRYWGVEQQHNINASVGMETNSTKYDAYKNITRGYDPERGKQFIVVDPTVYTSYANWMSENVPVVTDNLSNMLSWYGSISYSYGNWFTVNANVRYDGSNQFGERSNDKLLPIWSASFNYNVMEHFKGEQDWFDDLRLKMSYGYQGNMLDGQSPVAIISKKPYNDHYGEYVSSITTYPNPDLKWEKTGSLNVGVEFSMFQRRLMVVASYYRKKTEDAYLNKEISGVNGMTSYVVNGGEIVNSGYDFALTLNPIRKENLRWYVSTSFTHTNNEVNSLPGADQFERMNFLNGTAVVKGKSVSSFYSYKFTGLDAKGLPMFDDMEEEQESLHGKSKYEVFTQVLEESGRREPIIFGGLNTTVNYKRWRLNAAFSYSLGAKTRLFKLYADNGARVRPESNLNKIFLKRWQHPGDEKYTNIPAFMIDGGSSSSLSHWSCFTSGQVPEIADTKWEMYNYSNIRVVSADYLKCTNLGLTYSFDTERWGISLLEVSASVSNPFIVTNSKLKGQTPVQSGFTEVQLSERPRFTFRLNVTF